MRLIALTDIAEAGDMFDQWVGTQTETATEIEETFAITGFNCVVILNTYGVEASLLVDGVTQTVSLIRDSIKDWWDYWFASSRTGKDVVFYFPLQSSGNATITISYPGGTAKCGMCITGVAKEIADTKWGIEVGITDYSIIATDEFGQTYLNPGNWAKRVESKLTMAASSADVAYREIIKNRATACVFDYNEYTYSITERHTSDNGLQALVVYGFTEDYSADLIANSIATARHEVQGLI